jgi:hypothetical protein
MSLEKNADNELIKLRKLKYNLDWFNSNCKYFKNYANNQFVAIKDGAFLDKDFELERLMNRLQIENYDDSIIIEHM